MAVYHLHWCPRSLGHFKRREPVPGGSRSNILFDRVPEGGPRRDAPRLLPARLRILPQRLKIAVGATLVAMKLAPPLIATEVPPKTTPRTYGAARSRGGPSGTLLNRVLERVPMNGRANCG